MKSFTQTEKGWYRCPYCNAGTWHPEDHAESCYDYIKAERDELREQLQNALFVQHCDAEHIQELEDHINDLETISYIPG